MTGVSPIRTSAHVDTFCRDNLPPESQWPEFLSELPELRYPDRLNCAAELLDATIDRNGPDRRCLLTPDGETWTYGELRRAVDGIGRILVTELGIVPGNRVLLRGPNNPSLAACWLAVVKAGAVTVTTMPLLRSGELTKIAQISQPSLALCDDRFLADLEAADLGGASIVRYGRTSAADLTERVQEQAKAAGDGFAAADTAADDVAMLAFTSGTTG